jgi:hypothetical protein
LPIKKVFSSSSSFFYLTRAIQSQVIMCSNGFFRIL